MTFKASFIVNVGQYEHVELTVDGQEFADLFLGVDMDMDVALGDYHASLKTAILYGRDQAYAAISKPATRDERAPEALIQEELGGKVVAVQEQAAETPRKAWEVDLPAPPKAWEAVKAEVAAASAASYPSGPPVESPKEEFPF